ncbi:hypothetical protein KIM322_10480 [Lactobacillus xylocopicola]|uniref:Uncharacterized protein n=2 Tax=Lactobacillus xylocopicola TaxID=2976676 RepID=A0ABM8BHM6_9LACO|nr:hypothetical protein KIM322_10480 [Lactobacillus xylocopicola]
MDQNMDPQKQENLLVYFNFLREERKIESHLEKSLDNTIYFCVYSDKDFFTVLQWLGLVGAFFNFGKATEVDDIHDFMYEITITDYGLDLGKILKKASELGLDVSKYLK